MTSPEQEDFRRNLHGERVLKPKMPNPKYRIKEKDFAMQSSVKGATCRNVVMPVVDDRASTSKGIKSAILDMKCEVCRLRIYVCVGVGVRVCGCVCVWMHVFMLVCCNL